MGCSNIIEMSIKRRRHVVGLLNKGKLNVNGELGKKTENK